MPPSSAARFERDNGVRAARGLPQPPLDQALLQALPGLPDCAGVAVGVDRLLMAMADTARIADVLAFEFARALSGSGTDRARIAFFTLGML